MSVCRPETLPLGPDQDQHKFLCLPAGYIADQLEAWSLLNVKHNANYCDIQTLVAKEDLDNPDKSHTARSSKDMKKVCHPVKPAYVCALHQNAISCAVPNSLMQLRSKQSIVHHTANDLHQWLWYYVILSNCFKTPCNLQPCLNKNWDPHYIWLLVYIHRQGGFNAVEQAYVSPDSVWCHSQYCAQVLRAWNCLCINDSCPVSANLFVMQLIKRAKAYLKSGQAQEAQSELNKASLALAQEVGYLLIAWAWWIDSQYTHLGLG